MRSERPYTYLSTTRGMCRTCRKLTTSRIVKRDDAVYQVNICPECGNSEAQIAASFEWYSRMVRVPVRSRKFNIPGNPVQKGCPYDCGPCAFHSGACNLPVFSITNACDLACPICFTYNRTDKPYHMTRPEIASLLDKLIERSGPFDLVNLTGGEPTRHPDLFDLIAEARRPEIGRVTVNSNGLRLAREPGLAEKFAEAGAYVILSFDTFDAQTSVRLHGCDIVADKLKAVENLKRAGVGTTLLHVMVPEVNETEFGRVLDVAMAGDNIRSITVQNMTYTGFGGRNFEPRRHLPLDRCAQLIEMSSQGRVKASFFRPLPSAHPLCYQIAYLFKWQNTLYDFSELFNPGEMDSLLTDGYLLRPDGSSEALFHAALDRLWANNPDSPLLQGLKAIIRELFPPKKAPLTAAERQAIGEKYVLTIYLHAHMDEDNFDLARVCTCPDQVPDPEGRLISACSYNLFYRMKDPRFWKEE
jgi:hypothetical protein